MKHFQKLIYFAFGVIVTLAINRAVPTFAESAAVVKQLTANFTVGGNPISIFVDGNKISPKDGNGNAVDPFVVDGTTYLPVRAVSEALGKTVTWEGSTATVYIGQKPGAEVLLNDCAYGSTQFKFVSGGEYMLMTGKKYFNGFRIPDVKLSALFSLNGQYTQLNGIIGAADGSPFWQNVDVSILGDGKLLKSFTVTAEDLPKDFTVDVSGVLQLKIESDGKNYLGMQNGICMAELKLK